MKLLIINNYDSFTYNLYQYVGEILSADGDTSTLEVMYNDAITLNEIRARNYDKIIISPGPGNPSNEAYFGVCAKVITDFGKHKPVLGVCLGMQGIAHYFGGNVVRAQEPMHGKTSIIAHDGKGVFQDIPQNIEVMRYHSLVVEKESISDCFEITATTKDRGEIMGLRHTSYPIEGIQFHPESFATEGGRELLSNFILKT